MGGVNLALILAVLQLACSGGCNFLRGVLQYPKCVAGAKASDVDVELSLLYLFILHKCA